MASRISPDPRTTLAVVTGASSGIGRAFAERLAQQGFNLVLVGRDEPRLYAAAGELTRDYRVTARVIVADLSIEDGIESAAKDLEQGPPIGVLVNNAGFGTKGRLYEVEIDEQMRMVRLHTLAPMRLARAVLPGMVTRKSGWIINVSSIASFGYSAGNTNYCASKAYTTRFTESLETELVGTGVEVQALCPGFVRTEFHSRGKMDMSMVPEWMWLDPRRVADDSLRAIARGGPVIVVPGIHYRVIRRMIQLAPRWLMNWGRNSLRRT